MHKKPVIAALLALVGTAAILAFNRADDTGPLAKIVARLNNWAQNSPPEKVYLQLDKPFYAAGEDIWLKAYITLGSKHQLSALSNIVNVELIDDRGNIQQAIRLPVNNGTANGDFPLQDTLSAGNYHIRAYTNYMRNAGEAYFFDKPLVIGNSVTNNVFTKANWQLTQQNGKPVITATVTYTDLNGAAYAGKEINYDVQLNQKTVLRGKGLTDVNGQLQLAIANTLPGLVTNGRLITTIKYDARESGKQNIPIKITTGKVDVQFFPEGGSLVNGIRSKIAFKATGANGLGAAISGMVKDNEGNEIARLTTPHFGMGYVAFTPQNGKSYQAVITNPDGSESTVPLPPAVESGYTLMVANNNPDEVTVRVSVSKDLVNDAPGSEIVLVAQQNGALCFTSKTKLNTSSFAATIPKSRFITGLVQFTLFSAAGEPLNERVAFIQNNDLLNLVVQTNKMAYTPRQKTTVNLTAKDAAGHPAVGSFSATVLDEGKIPADEDSETTILSYLLLTSDLKGYIEKPNYYFNNSSDETRANLDVLMLTQGYRRFVWQQILADHLPVITYQPEKSITITGAIKTLGGKPIPQGKIMLVGTTGDMLLLDTIADAQGRFIFKDLAFTDSSKFVIQARNAKDRKNVLIELDKTTRPPAPQNTGPFYIPVTDHLVMSNYLLNSKNQFREEQKFGLGNHVTALKEVVIKQTKTKAPEYSANIFGAGKADQVLTPKEIGTGCINLLQCLTGKLNSVTFTAAGVPIKIGRGPMLVIVDGVEGSLDMNPNDVESVEVLGSAAAKVMYNSAGGAIIVTTKRYKTDDDYMRDSPGIITYAPKGFYKARQFYAPQYDRPDRKDGMADLRSTICWHPNIITDKDGNASFEFFNADGKGTYRVIVEGIDGNGNLGRTVYRYKVGE